MGESEALLGMSTPIPLVCKSLVSFKSGTGHLSFRSAIFFRARPFFHKLQIPAGPHILASNASDAFHMDHRVARTNDENSFLLEMNWYLW
jgi:hypothetical protein